MSTASPRYNLLANQQSLRNRRARHLLRHLQIFLVAAEKPRGSSNSSLSALKEAVAQIAAKSCCLCLRNVTADAFLSLDVQQLLLKQLQASLVSWRGPASSPACPASTNGITEHQQTSCPVIGDGGGNGNAAALQNDGTLILKVDPFTAQVLGIDTRIRLPHFMRRILPPGTQYLKLNVQHPAVLRHQQKQQKHQKQRQDLNQQPSDHTDSTSLISSSSCSFPPSRLYDQMQRSLRSLEPMDFLAATTPSQDQGENNLEKRLAIALDLQSLLRASGSLAALCHLVQLECRLSVYRGGVVDTTNETAMTFDELDSEDPQDLAKGSSMMLTPDFPASRVPQQLLLPDWPRLFNLATSAAPQQRMENQGEVKATVMIRRKNRRGAACRNGSRTRGRELQEKQTGGGLSDKGGDDDFKCQTNDRSTLPAEPHRHFPPLFTPYLEGLQLLHERQRQARSERINNRKMGKQTQTTGDSAEEEGPSPEVLQLAAPPPFKKSSPAEALFSSVTEYLGCVAMGIPTNKDCGWLREADRVSDPQGIRVASVSGGLVHSNAVVAAAECLYRWLQAEGQGAWVAISVVGTAETSVIYTNQPHGSDLIGESTLHLLLAAEQNGEVRGMLLQTIGACDATTTLP
ncbi:hypothetical protein Emag_005946 [Eimeria magna]